MDERQKKNDSKQALATNRQRNNVSKARLNAHKCLIVFGSFIIYFFADGVSLSIGIFLREFIHHFSEDSVARTSITVGLLQSMPLFLSPLVCFLVEKYGCRLVAFIGSILLFSSFIFTKFFVESLTALYITVGVVTSTGLAMVYISAYLIISFYFTKRRALATGVAVSGSGLGIFILSPIMELLIREYAWKDAFFIFGALCSHTFISVCLYRLGNEPKPQQEEISTLEKDESQTYARKLMQLARNRRYVVLTASYALLSFLTTAPYNFLPSHLQQHSIEDKHSLSLSFIGIGTVVGQLIIGFLSDRFCHFTWLIYSVCLVLAGGATLILPSLRSLYFVNAYSMLFGLFVSVNYVLQSILVIESVGLPLLTLAFGFIQLVQGFSTFTGTLAGGWLKDLTGDYDATFYASGVCIALSGLLLTLWPCASPRNALRSKL